jgi:hypothetical protein
MFTDIYLYDDQQQKYPDVVFMGIQSGSLPSNMLYYYLLHIRLKIIHLIG